MSAATKAATASTVGLLLVAVTAAITGAITAAVTGSAAATSAPSAAALADIPPDYLALYRTAATGCPGLDWSVLAAIGKIETDHGRSTLPGVSSGHNAAGAAGPMQFLQPTFDAVLARHRLPPGGQQPPSRYDAHDAVHAAAAYLCDSGAPTDLRAAVYAYNHSNRYVQQVLARAATYRASAPTRTGDWPAQTATLPDPTGTGGRLTPRMHALYTMLAATGATSGGATCWDRHPQNPASDHPRGKACDLFFDPTDPAEVNRGWQLAHQLTAAQTAHGVHYLIWQGQIWTAQKPTWTRYTSGIYGCPNPANRTGCHYDHIHISVY